MNRSSNRAARNGKDQGSALILVLVMTVIASLVVIPLLQYSMAVQRHNTVLSNKTKRLEAVKAGLRVALADPNHAYAECGEAGPGVSKALPSVTVNGIGVNTVCYFIEWQSALLDDQLRFGLVSTQVGETIPVELKGNEFVPTTTSSTEWISHARRDSLTDQIWYPELPSHATTLRTRSYEMPKPVGQTPPPPTCTVFFPGTYRDPITITGQTFFTSGVYYFEDEVKITAGADVVVGAGVNSGCTFDQEAAYYSIDGPEVHNISGMGATWLLGDRGRVVVDNTTGTGKISLLFNRRYVQVDGDPVPKPRDISIASVNGELLIDGSIVDLDEPNVIHVPRVLSATETVPPATLLPSLYTPKPKAPDQVLASTITTQARSGALIVSWTAPFDNGSPITGYDVAVTSGTTNLHCATTGATTCAVRGSTNNTAYSVAVTATNARGAAVPSSPITGTPSGTAVGAPTWPATPLTVTAYKGAARVTWPAAVLGTGGLPLKNYVVTAYLPSTTTVAGTCSVDATTGVTPTPLSCIVDFTAPYNATGYTFSVVANIEQAASTALSTTTPTNVDPVIDPALPNRPTDPTPPVYGKFQPVPIVDFQLSGASEVVVAIPGYVSIPQGRIRLINPNKNQIDVVGGILAAQFTVDDGRAKDASGNIVPDSIGLGFVEAIVQRKFRIVSTTSGGTGATSTAIVQINQTGAYAVNSWSVQ